MINPKQEYLMEGVTADIIYFLTKEEKMSVKDAMRTVFNSVLYEKLYDPESGLYSESSAYNYDLLKDELKYGKFVQNEI
ncbi:MAG: hypothetical protein LBM59_07460 [Ruminococcus sp.]|jgi:hypothetical protein|nr:hypothetical protein [Ruminococcus sp.]